MKIKRIYAYIIDLVIINVIVSLIGLMPVFDQSHKAINEYTNTIINNMIDSGSADPDEEKIQNDTYEMTRKSAPLNLISVGITVLYFGAYGFIANGQTIGKKIAKIKIVTLDEKTDYKPGQYLIREIIKTNVAYDLLDIIFIIFLNRNLYLNSNNLITILSSITSLAVIGTMIFRDDERGLHDVICKTKVISTATEQSIPQK